MRIGVEEAGLEYLSQDERGDSACESLPSLRMMLAVGVDAFAGRVLHRQHRGTRALRNHIGNPHLAIILE